MLRLATKRAVLAALRRAPDYSQLDVFRKLGKRDLSRTLRWLDDGGLSLYLLSGLQEHSAQSCLPRHVLAALEQRLEANRARTGEWLRDFQAISETLTEGNIQFVALKGVTVVPDFCPRFDLRHQADIDLWIKCDSVENALARLAQLGFTPRSVGVGGQISLAGPGEERVSLNESIYRAGRSRRLEIHISLLEEALPTNMQYPTGQWERATQRAVGNISFCSLAPADMFIYQAYHAFNHILGYWARPSWLYEIARFLDANCTCSGLWTDVCESIGENTALRDRVGMIVSLVEQLFSPRVSSILSAYCLQCLPLEMILWNRHFGERVVLSGTLGDKVGLLIQKCFVNDPAVWSKHFWRRLLPVRPNLRLTEICGKTLGPTFVDRWNQLRFMLRKMKFHGSFLVVYPFHALRWRFVRDSARTGSFSRSAGG
jgi:hypothetical protein